MGFVSSVWEFRWLLTTAEAAFKRRQPHLEKAIVAVTIVVQDCEVGSTTGTGPGFTPDTPHLCSPHVVKVGATCGEVVVQDRPAKQIIGMRVTVVIVEQSGEASWGKENMTI